ncbi:hypothetical protein [Croceibacterium ferulae]|uniref:hypothetical protein n=1 Tax=Croceibacterium ferulae TaxID=1854641 RepID=UPI000F89C493|nr:hypothetical protein [Croceibacterium ferulae]
MLGSSAPERNFTEYTGRANAFVQRSTSGSSFKAMSTIGAGAATLGDVIQKGRGGTVRLIGRGDGGSNLADSEASGSTQRSGTVAAAIAGKVLQPPPPQSPSPTPSAKTADAVGEHIGRNQEAGRDRLRPDRPAPRSSIHHERGFDRSMTTLRSAS